MAEKGSQSQDFFWQHREYHSWESTEENDTIHGGSWGGGGGAWGPPLGYGLIPVIHGVPFLLVGLDFNYTFQKYKEPSYYLVFLIVAIMYITNVTPGK